MMRLALSCSRKLAGWNSGILDCVRHALHAGVIGLLLSTASISAMPQEGSPESVGKCPEADAERAIEKLTCAGAEQFRKIAQFRERLLITRSAPDPYSLRDTLVVASKLSACVNDYHLFPKPPSERADFHCLQRHLLDFYEETRKWTADSDLQFQDLLAHASSRVHYCMIDEDLPVLECIALMEAGLEDYRRVFQQLSNQTGPAEAQTAGTGSNSLEPTAPGLVELEQFVDLSLENSRRFPNLLGQQFGSVLGPAICQAYTEFPESRDRLAFLYNVLIRFDFANLASSSRLYAFIRQLEETFRLEPGAPSYLRLDPPDWSPSGVPCGAEEWQLVFPKMVLAPGFRLPPTKELRARLEDLNAQLADISGTAGDRTHLWKPFFRYGQLLLNLAESLNEGSLRGPAQWESRHLLMEKARDAFLLRGVESSKYPRETELLHEPISHQIDAYGTELLNGLYFAAVIDFAEDYLKNGEMLLSSAQKAKLHELLAVGYRMSGDQLNTLSHLQQSELKPLELERIVEEYRQFGVIVPRLNPVASE
jgi:hypothetical protein